MIIGSPTSQSPAAWAVATLFPLGYRYQIHPAETAFGLTKANLTLGYDPGDLRRYQISDLTGGTNYDAQIANAIGAATAAGGWGFIYHAGGTIAHANQISVPNGLSVLGWNRAYCIFKFTGTPAGAPAYTRSAWRNVNGPNSSGYANVAFRHVQINVANTVNFGAAIELNAGGWSYYEIEDCWIKGGCSYGVILDGVEIGSIHNCLFENANATSNYHVWIVNGGDRVAAQAQGYTNTITIRENQFAATAADGAFGVVDDGGNLHAILQNNFNNHRTAIVCAGATGLKISGNNVETTNQTGYNIQFNQATAAGTPCGPCAGFEITSNTLYGDIVGDAVIFFDGALHTITGISKAASAVVTVSDAGTTNPFVVNQLLFFSGINGMTQMNGLGGTVTAIGGASGAWTATVNINSSGFGAWTSGGQAQGYHSGGFVKGNIFGNALGRGAAIDVTFLANSECSCNTDFAITGGAGHYNGAHTDNNGNYLGLPTNGFTGGTGYGITGPILTDARAAGYMEGGANITGNVAITGNETLSGSIGLNGKAAPAQVTGFGNPTGATVISNFAAGSATLVQCAETIAQILAILLTRGDIGA